jgi:hypothetical protein
MIIFASITLAYCLGVIITLLVMKENYMNGYADGVRDFKYEIENLFKVKVKE